MGVLDYVIIGFLALFLVWGFMRGFTWLIFKVLVLVITLALCLFASRPIANQIMKTSLGGKITEIAAKPLEGLDIDAAIVIKTDDGYMLDVNGDAAGGLMSVDKAFEQLKIPSYLEDEAIKSFGENGVPLKTILTSVVARMALTGICAVALGIVAGIILTMIKFVLVKRIKGRRALLDRAGGAVLNVAYGFLLVTLAFAVLNLLSGFSFMRSVNEYIAGNTVANWFYANNWFAKLLNLVSGLFV